MKGSDGSGTGGGGARLGRRLRHAGSLARALALRAGVRLTGGQGRIGSRLARIAAPLEASPFLETGRRAPLQHASKLGPDDYHRLLEAAAALGKIPYEELGGATRGVGLRLDLGTGLSEAALELARMEASLGVASLRAISPFVAGDLVAFSEGHLGIEPRAWPLLHELGGTNGRGFACLNELPDALLASQADPWLLYAELERAFRKQGLPLRGFVTGLGEDPASDLAWLLLHRGAWDGIPDELLASYGLLANELRRPGGKGRALAALEGAGPRPAADFDWVERIELDAIPGGAIDYSRRLGRTVPRVFRPRVVSTVPARLETTPSGFQLRDRDGAARALPSTDAALAALRTAAAAGPVAVICDVAHLSGEAKAVSGERLRLLPHPFHHALALSSDVDWSSEAQVRAGFERLNGELGLPVAGSFFLEGPPGTSVAAVPIAKDTADGFGVVAELAARGGMDTLHAFRSNVHTLRLVRDGDAFVMAADAGPIRGEAILVGAEGDPSRATLHVSTDAGDWKLPPERITESTPSGLLCFPLPDAWRDRGLVCEALRVRLEGATAREVMLTDFAPGRARDALARVADDHVAPLVFTTHGGGARDVVGLGNLHVGAAIDEAAHDMDRADRPYHLLPDLLHLGVRFFSPRGHAGIATLQPADALVHDTCLRDGSRVGLFRRFLSRRQGALGLPEGWAFGKNAANPAALGFQISDLLLRFHWAPEGRAAILYNHFGHNVGNQRNDRLAWSEELHGAFERIAALHHPDGADAPAYRLWVCPASSLLLHDRVRRSAEPHLAIVDSDVSLASFHEGLLGVDPTDRARFGTRLLHGLTVFVEDADQARLEIAGEAVHAFTRNPARAGEGASISIVDDSAPRSVLLAANVLAEDHAGCRVDGEADAFEITLEDADAEVVFMVPAVPLDAATHWSAEWESGTDGGLELAWRDTRGVWYRAGAEADWPLPVATGSPGYFALAARRGSLEGRPQGALTGVRVRVRGGRAGDRVRLRRFVLLRPDAHLRDRRDPRLLAGRVVADGAFASEGLTVEARRLDGEGAWQAPVMPDGRFVLRKLPADVRVRCELVRGERRTTSLRGAEAWLLSDLVGWDFRVAGGDGASGGR